MTSFEGVFAEVVVVLCPEEPSSPLLFEAASSPSSDPRSPLSLASCSSARLVMICSKATAAGPLSTETGKGEHGETAPLGEPFSLSEVSDDSFSSLLGLMVLLPGDTGVEVPGDFGAFGEPTGE